MPSEAPVPNIRKRKLSVGIEPTIISSLPPPAKRRKREKRQRQRTPSWFWDNLSRLWLTPRALREFDRRTEWPAAPVPPKQTGKEDINLAQLKRFARHGGPALGDLRAVSQIQPSRNELSDCSLVSGAPYRTAFPSKDGLKSIGL